MWCERPNQQLINLADGGLSVSHYITQAGVLAARKQDLCRVSWPYYTYEDHKSVIYTLLCGP